MIVELSPICGVQVGFEFVNDDAERYCFIYLFILSIMVKYE